LDAFEQLQQEQGALAPTLMVIGNKGWMSEGVQKRLADLQEAGRCRWLQGASDEQLVDAYSKTCIFSYLSLSEGFGYPPFEAAFAGCPMVLSNASSVGEIWMNHARCVNPTDVQEIVEAWKWALALSGPELEGVLARQTARANEFTWDRIVREYLSFMNQLVGGSSAYNKLCKTVKE
jgi:glycosyltransferase involved in cell wall biosynthesis